MTRFMFLIFLSVSIFAVRQPQAVFAQSAQPDLSLAYVLATASYCAYAVGEADSDRQKRAAQCLKAAADRDQDPLEVLDVTQDNVEAYFNPVAPEDAYLLVQTRIGVILAFRGTLTPPLFPSGGRFPAAVADAVAKYREREAKLLATFVDDWRKNFRAFPNTQNRHSGFDTAWSGLQTHLMARDCVANAGSVSGDCSKFLSFVARLRDAASLKLYVTGHSKGGALATLAALDLPNLVGAGIVPVVYTFASAKALTTDGAIQAATGKDMWRFEHEFDIVPSVPPDTTVFFWSGYSHLGRRAFFAKGEPPRLSSGPLQGIDPPGDRVRLTSAVAKLFSSGWQLLGAGNFFQSIFDLGEVNCQALVDNHFLIFADVQEAARARHGDRQAPITITEANLSRSFFATGLSDGEGNILWGFSQWCALLKGPGFGPGEAPK